MMLLKNQSIKNKIIIINMVIILIISIIAGFTFIISEINNQKELLYNNVRLDTKIIMEAISGSLDFNYTENAEKILSKMSVKPYLKDCIIFDKNDKFFISHTKKHYKKDKFAFFKNKDHYYANDTFYYISDVLNSKDKKIGSILISISTDTYKDKINSYIKNITALLILVFIISFVLSTVLQKLISKPIIKLSEITKGITEKKGLDLNIDIIHKSNDEIGVLYNNFNNMIKAIREKENERKIVEKERYKLQIQLQQSQKMEAIGQLAGGIAHDFNNILTAINGYADLAISKIKDDHTLLKMLSIIRESGERATELTKQLLAFSRKQVIEKKTIELSSVISSLERMLKRLIEANTELKVELNENCFIDADKGQIEQIIVNLIVNARDAILMNKEENTKKLINLQTNIVNVNDNMDKVLDLQNGKYVLLSISDTGIGMTNEIKNKIFEPFFTTKPRDKGTGLGLATVYGIVKQNNGTVYVYSEINKGTTFKIYWPLSKLSIKDSDHKIDTRKLIGGHEKILIVEDNKSVLDFTESALISIGYNIVTANSGEIAMEIAAEHNYDFALIISDVIMPGMSGPEFVQKIKQKNPKLKFLYASGYTFDLIVKKGVVEKNINFISKPYNTIDLSLKIRNIIDT